MRVLHIFLAVLALVSVAMLPGPSLAASAGQHHPSMAMAGHGAPGAHEHCPDHKPRRACALACCCPAVVDLASPVLALAARVRIVRASWRARDDQRPGTSCGPLLRPPTLA